MIKSIQFKNFKALRDTTIELGRFNLLIGPNGSGKSTVMEGVRSTQENLGAVDELASLGCNRTQSKGIELTLTWTEGTAEAVHRRLWYWNGNRAGDWQSEIPSLAGQAAKAMAESRVYCFQPEQVAAPVTLEKNMTMGRTGLGLPGVLDRLRDNHPERFEALNEELHRWIPEFDRVLFDTPDTGKRAFSLRLTGQDFGIGASQLSSGTLTALAILTLVYLPDPPPVIGLEEPDHGLHPRLLRDVRDAIYRLCYPEDFGEKRRPVQVIATTHSPYMVDLFLDHLEEVIICEKTADNVVFRRLSDLPHVEEIVQGAHLGDLWYSGILGGVPAGT